MNIKRTLVLAALAVGTLLGSTVTMASAETWQQKQAHQRQMNRRMHNQRQARRNYRNNHSYRQAKRWTKRDHDHQHG